MGPLMAAPRDAGVSLIGIGWIVIRQLSSSHGRGCYSALLCAAQAQAQALAFT